MLPHHRDVNGVAGGEVRRPEHDLAGEHHRLDGDRKQLVDHAEQRVEGGLNRVAPANRDVSMQDFLQRLGVAHQPPIARRQPFEQPLRICADRAVS